MSTMKHRSFANSLATGEGWSLTTWPYPDPAEVEDDRPKAVATEKLYRYLAGSWRLAYAIGDEYPLEEQSELRTIEQMRVDTVNHEIELSQERHPSTQGGRICPEPGCGVTLPERGFGPHLAKHRRERE